jgi:hypothetical protein
MSRPTSKNFYGGGRSEETAELRAQLARKEEEHRLLLDKYDRLFISKRVFIQARTRSPRSSRLLARGYWRGNWRSCRQGGRKNARSTCRTSNG